MVPYWCVFPEKVIFEPLGAGAFSFLVIFVESGMFFAIFSAAESEMVAFFVTEVVESIFTFSFSGIVSVADTPPSFCLSPDVFELQAATKQHARKKRSA